MSRVFGYELRRLLINKFFLALALITGGYSYSLLGGDIVAGVAFTAPFSGWSYGAFLTGVAPILMVTVLFFISYLYAPVEKRTQALTMATPVNPRMYGLVKLAAVAAGALLICGVAVGVSLVFYAAVFGFTAFGCFLSPLAFVLAPCMLLAVGAGMAAGRIHPALIYGLMLACLVIGRAGLPAEADLLGSTFFYTQPLSLPVPVSGEPAFFIPTGVLAGRVIYGAAGLLLTVAGVATFGRGARRGNG